MNRISFGQEAKLEILQSNCPGCDVERGQYHEYGCPLESCPECGSRLLECSCQVLSIPDEFRLTRAVAETMTREQVLNMAEESKHLDRTYEEKAGFMWITQNAPPELQAEMKTMALDILGATKHGDMMHVPHDKAAEALGLSKEDAALILNELEADCLYPDWEQHTGMEQ